MIKTMKAQAKRVELDLDASTFEKIIRIINVIGFSSVEDFLRVAIKKEVDYYSILLGNEGTGKK
jgi:hypothetical protein